MLNTKKLKSVLKEIFGVDDKYLVPLDEGWYVPTYDKTDKVGTWIGYRIMTKKPNVRTFTGHNSSGPTKIKSIKVTFRISFIGPQAEELCDQTLMWDDRQDVKTAFEQQDTQLNYVDRQVFSYPVKNGGLNDNLCWCVDFPAQTFYEVPTGWKKWNISSATLEGDITIPKTGGLNGY